MTTTEPVCHLCGYIYEGLPCTIKVTVGLMPYEAPGLSGICGQCVREVVSALAGAIIYRQGMAVREGKKK